MRLVALQGGVRLALRPGWVDALIGSNSMYKQQPDHCWSRYRG
jgi:hypothetical protein